MDGGAGEARARSGTPGPCGLAPGIARSRWAMRSEVRRRWFTALRCALPGGVGGRSRADPIRPPAARPPAPPAVRLLGRRVRDRPGPARRLPDRLHGDARLLRALPQRRAPRGPPAGVRARSAHPRPVPQVDGEPPAREPRPLPRVPAAERGADRGAAGPDRDAGPPVVRLHLARRRSRRDLLGHPPAVAPRLRPHRPELRRGRHAELHAGAGPDVGRLRLLRHRDHRAALLRVRRGAVEPGPGDRPAEAHLAAGGRPRRRRHGAAHPADAGEPPGRTEQALRHHRPGQGTLRVAAGPPLPRAARPQPAGEHDRLVPARPLLGQPDRRDRDEPAQHRTAPPPGAGQPGHVPGRQHPAHLLLPDHRRHPPVRRAAGLAGPAHPHGAVGVATRSVEPEDERVLATDVLEAGEPSSAEDRVSVASNWTLVWWRFRKHRLALISVGALVALYAVVLCPDVFSTYDPEATDARLAFIPIQRVHLFDGWRWSP